MAINNPVITDSDWLQATAVAIQNKDGGSKMEVPDFASRIEALNVADKWELLNEVTLDADVSIIKIDISTYKNDYSAFLVAPQLTPSQYTEWLYCGWEDFKGAYTKGAYGAAALTTGVFKYPQYFCYYSRDLGVIIQKMVAGRLPDVPYINTAAYIILSLYQTQSTFLSGGSYRLYGKKTEDYLNVD